MRKYLPTTVCPVANLATLFGGVFAYTMGARNMVAMRKATLGHLATLAPVTRNLRVA